MRLIKQRWSTVMSCGRLLSTQSGRPRLTDIYLPNSKISISHWSQNAHCRAPDRHFPGLNGKRHEVSHGASGNDQ